MSIQNVMLSPRTPLDGPLIFQNTIELSKLILKMKFGIHLMRTKPQSSGVLVHLEGERKMRVWSGPKELPMKMQWLPKRPTARSSWNDFAEKFP
jgi:hypothetical protein